MIYRRVNRSQPTIVGHDMGKSWTAQPSKRSVYVETVEWEFDCVNGYWAVMNYDSAMVIDDYVLVVIHGC